MSLTEFTTLINCNKFLKKTTILLCTHIHNSLNILSDIVLTIYSFTNFNQSKQHKRKLKTGNRNGLTKYLSINIHFISP